MITGSTADLVPQLLGMFDELAKRPSTTAEATSQKRLSLVAAAAHHHHQRRQSRTASVILDMSPAPEDHRLPATNCHHHHLDDDDDIKSSPRLSRHGSPTQFR